MTTIDLNADLGEGFGIYRLAQEPALLDLVTSANVACGAHAGDPMVMRETVALARARGVTIGAHPGYPDREGFGRRELGATPAELAAMVITQVGALAAVCAAAGARLRYVKPHGALYNRLARDWPAAVAVAEAIREVDPALHLLGLDGSLMIRAAEDAGLRGVREAFVDRGYRPDGSLVPRGEPGALLGDPELVADRALRMVAEHHVVAVDGTRCLLHADSLCTHGDGPNAVALVQAVRRRLAAGGVQIASFAQ
ncbi:MAG: 5-oxoprolinase subunit PxpA [Gemmatimonadota bacterium]|nr:5-oxoprolinase subunit PxpA [Gemmatimonadota bacterium]